MNVINKLNELHDRLNKFLDQVEANDEWDDMSYIADKLSDELYEELGNIKNCINCKENKNKCNIEKFYKSLNKIEERLVVMEGGDDYDEYILDQINKQLFKIINIR